MCSETKTKIVRDIIAIVFVSAEENNCKLRNCRWKFQETANVVFATSKVWRILFLFAFAPMFAPHTAVKSVIFVAAINPYACFYIFLIWLILIYPRPLESIPQNWFLVSINSIVELYWFGRGREGPWPKSIQWVFDSAERKAIVKIYCQFPEAVDMNRRFQMQGGKNWFLPKEMNANRFFWDSHWLEIWSNHFYPSMGPNGGSVAMDSAQMELPSAPLSL